MRTGISVSTFVGVHLLPHTEVLLSMTCMPEVGARFGTQVSRHLGDPSFDKFSETILGTAFTRWSPCNGEIPNLPEYSEHFGGIQQ